VLATPIRWSGSLPLTASSKLLLRDDRTIRGTIGGGALEADVIAQASEMISEDRPRIIDFDLTGDQAARSGMICGGRCSILLEPIAPDYSNDAFGAAARAEREGDRVALVTLLPPEKPARKVVFSSDGEPLGSAERLADVGLLADLARECCGSERPQFVERPVRAHIGPLLPLPSVVVFGGGHIAVPLAYMAGLVGFRVAVVDDREEFANRERFPFADAVVVATVSDAFRGMAVDENTYVIAVTRGHAMDEDVVAEALRTSARYVGMIGSKRKVSGVLGRLRERGFSGDDLARVHAPIGLDIGSETVEEIAVSIVAELIAVRRQHP
jgi:xanthine dehydrogenase accessory factor